MSCERSPLLRSCAATLLFLALWSTNVFAFGDTVKFRKCDPSKIGSAFSPTPKLLGTAEVVVHAKVVKLLRSSNDRDPSPPSESHLAVIAVDQVLGPGADQVITPIKLVLNVFNPEGSCDRPIKIGDEGFVSGDFRRETREHRFGDLDEKLDFLLAVPDPSRFLPE